MTGLSRSRAHCMVAAKLAGRRFNNEHHYYVTGKLRLGNLKTLPDFIRVCHLKEERFIAKILGGRETGLVVVLHNASFPDGFLMTLDGDHLPRSLEKICYVCDHWLPEPVVQAIKQKWNAENPPGWIEYVPPERYQNSEQDSALEGSSRAESDSADVCLARNEA